MNLSVDLASALHFFDLSLGVLPDPDLTLRKMGKDTRVFEAIRCDPDVESCIEDRKAWTLLKRWAWHPGDESKAAKKLCEKVAKILTPPKMKPHIEAMLEAPLYGMIPIEPVWDVLDALIVPVDFRALPTQSIRFDIHRRPHLCTAHAVFPTPIPEGKIVLVRRNYDWEQPYGRKLFSALFWPVVFRRGGLKFWYDFMDRFGIPQTIAKLSKAMYEDKRDEVEGQLEKLVRDAVAVMEEGVEISTHEAKGTAASDFFERFQNHIGDTISRVITGATLQRSTGQKGSYAQAREHGQTGNRRGLLDEMMVEAAFNEVAEFIARFSAPNVAPPYMQYDRPQDLHNERATRDARLGGLGARFSLDYFMREYGFREGDIVEISQDAALEFARRTNAHQDEIDDLVAEQLVQGGTVADAQAQRIVRALKSENSPSQIEDILSDIAGEDADAYADLMGEVLMAADMYGRESLRDEVGT